MMRRSMILSTIATTPPFARRRARLAGLVGLAGLALAACTSSPEEATAVTREAQGAARGGQTIVLAGPGATARVSRDAPRGGEETMRGETDVLDSDGARRRIVEEVTLGADGQLVAADIAVTGAAEETRIHLDPRRGLVRLESTSAAGSRELRVPGDAPWIYEVPVEGGQAWATPVSAWVALRAAATSPWVRRIQADKPEGWLIPRDQIAVATERGTTVAIGADGADADRVFIREIRLAGPGVTLVRAPAVGRLVL